MIVSQWVMHRDPRFFLHPERFDPGRWTGGLTNRLPRYAYFPFGGGPRGCIGSRFALMEAMLILATVCRRFHLAPVPGARVVASPSITLRPQSGVRLVLHRR